MGKVKRDLIAQPYRCPSCYFAWEEEREVNEYVPSIKVQDKECSWCEIHPFMSERQRLERSIDILEDTQINDYPKIIRLMYDLLSER